MKTFALAALAMVMAATASAQPPAAPPPAASSPAAGEWKPGEPPPDMTTYYLVMLVKGPKWTPGSSPALEELQREHLTHRRKLALAGKLVLGGPLTDGGTIRGLGVFKVASLEEARALQADDPAVKAGRLAVQVHPWLVQKGILP